MILIIKVFSFFYNKKIKKGGDPLTLLEMERWDGRGKGGAWNSKSSNLEHDPRKVSLDFSNE